MAPDRPIDTSDFPDLTVEGRSPSYAPGALDALEGRFKADLEPWRDIAAIVDEVNDGRITSVADLDRRLTGLRAGGVVDKVLDHLRSHVPSDSALGLFWGVALSSHDYNAVKWGISIGGIRATRKTVKELLVFARHGEFTIYACIKLLATTTAWPEVTDQLLDLLKVLDGWAVIRLAFLLARQDRFRDNPLSSAAILKSAILQSGIIMEAAYPLAEMLDLRKLFELAVSDNDLFRAVWFMMDELLTLDPAPYGGIVDLANGSSILESYIRLLEERTTDIHLLGAISAAIRFLTDVDVPFGQREVWLGRCSRLMDRKYDEDVVRGALPRKATRWIALGFIRNRPSQALLDDLRAIASTETDENVVDVLGALGTQEDLERLARRLGDVIDVDDRSRQPMRHSNTLGPVDRANFYYASVIRAIAGLRSSLAAQIVKRAMVDYDPHIRAQACKAVGKLSPTLVDADLIALLEERLTDSPPYVRDAAEAAKQRLSGDRGSD